MDVNTTIAASAPECEYDNSTTDCIVPPTYESNIAITILIVVLLVLGVVGNVATLSVIIKNKNLRTNFNLFLISLCASDLVSACICSPLWLYRRTWGFEDWNWGPLLCKFYWVADFATDFTTSLHILSFCLLRFVAFSCPFSAPTTRLRKIHFRMYIVSLWTCSFLLAAPHVYFMEVREKHDGKKDPWPSCSIHRCRKEQYHIYSVVVYSLFFYVPAILIIILSFFTTRYLRKMSETWALSRFRDTGRVTRIRQRNQAACNQLRLICACFTFGYVPVAAYLIWTSARSYEKKDCASYVMDYWFGVASYLILRISECLNPVMYNLGCSEMRQATLRFVKNSVFRQASRAVRLPAQQKDIMLSSLFQSSPGPLPGEAHSREEAEPVDNPD